MHYHKNGIGLHSCLIVGFSLLFFLILPADEASAQQRLPCTSFRGEPVQYIPDPQLPDVGMATWYLGRPVVFINPTVLRRFSPLAQQWWFAHECAHHALHPSQNSEIAADCFASRALRDLGFIHDWQSLQQVMSELSGLPGNVFTGHLPGPARAEQVRQCVLN